MYVHWVLQKRLHLSPLTPLFSPLLSHSPSLILPLHLLPSSFFLPLPPPSFPFLPSAHTYSQDPIEFQMHELRKYFKVGDHVKVVAGRYEGDTGMVVKMESSLAIVFSDLTMSEVGGGRGGNEVQFYYELLDSASLA